ncbi:N-acetyl-gamma-glutamyl-phosphate reductase [Pseudovibrio axinellae]|uniref:N-acetyl-gamma-glutamyl-phosphate reductase n=1 Tax=Pseudovibrio axinellae TaxID=989403 RepID=A0A165Z9S9_9HYPH|nr:N-acetyl-gamma-glutamyl-phosphate reductase [Pseudovibrio axinellae]KZL19633.1 N-acetyl-gamma-glutamyl-phosphate reductase [Pseudovibrio axinellae]SEQ34949.1 N-acetyl-gamma-glutamyl-phosphate reductase [Pseudovibrio axinellae]
MSVRVFIDGEAGTTGLQIRERLAGRRDIEILSIAPERRKELEARADLLNSADVAILCLPDDAALESISMIKNDSTRVIDASSAHRVSPDWAYGFPEMTKDQADIISTARFVSNPGCYPQGVIATVRPLLEAGLIPSTHALTVNAVSGYTGGGRKMIESYESNERSSPFWPYALQFGHKHLPEIQLYADLAHAPLFQPSVGNYAQGMMTFVPLQLGQLRKAPKGKDLHAALADHFSSVAGDVEVAPFEGVDAIEDLSPEMFNGTNHMRLHVFANDDKAQALLVAIYDNLGKGASGAAVQNLNIMMGLNENVDLCIA